MSFIVTARKWRPRRFDEVIGQEHISTTLKNAIKNGRIAHAYIFAGPRGVGKTTTARILAKALNCLNPKDSEPCNVCEMCLSVQNSQSLDIIEIDGASNRRIEEIRALRESVKYAPTKGFYKVYIIDEVHMLTNESFNALLKTLEEPPEHTIFIFATTDVHKVPLTIISRCQRFDFRRIQLDDIKSLLLQISQKENITIDDKTLTVIARKADGALRDAQSVFDQVVSFCGSNIDFSVVSKMLNLIDEEIYFEISEAVLSKEYVKAFTVSKKVYDNGWNFIDFINGLIEHFRNIFSAILTKDSSLIETAEIYQSKYLEYVNKFSESDLLRILALLNKTQNEIRGAQNQRIKVEITLSHLIGLEKSSSISSALEMLRKTPISEYSGKEEQNNSVKKKVVKTEEEYNKPSPEITEQQHEISEADKGRWKTLLEKIKENKYLLHALLEDTNLSSQNNGKLILQCFNKETYANLKSHLPYLTEQYQETFKEKVVISLDISDASLVKTESQNASAEEKYISLKNEEENDPLINAIIKELDGREISE